MILSAENIQWSIDNDELAIDPYNPAMLKEASYTFTLGNMVHIPGFGVADLRKGKLPYIPFDLPTEFPKGYRLMPRSFVLGQTAEKLTLSSALSCILAGRGSVAQVGLDVVQSSIFAEPSTDQHLTLEISNNGNAPVILYPGMPLVKGIFIPVK